MLGTGEKEDNDAYSHLFKACIGRFGNPYFKDADGLVCFFLWFL